MGRRRCVSFGLLVCLTGCTEVVTQSDGPSPPSSSSSSSPALTWQEVLRCDGDPACFEAARQTKTIEEQHERDRALAAKQHEEQLRATNRAAGLDPDAGKGWWCYSGMLGERPLGECRRAMDRCTDLLLSREEAGLVVEDRRCKRHAKAACFVVTRSLEEGERRICFDTLDVCNDMRGRVDTTQVATPPSTCEASD